MTRQPLPPIVVESRSSWQTKVYGLAVGVGAVVGVVAAYFYMRAADEDTSGYGHEHRATTTELASIGLAIVAILRQVAELGRGPVQGRR